MSDPRTRIAALVLGSAAAIFTWWGWKQGAYFGTVFYPGAILAWLLLALVLSFAPLSLRLRGAARLAPAALAALAAWTLLSALWSAVPSDALGYAAHDLAYLAFFALGLLATNLLGRRMRAALLAPALAVALLGAATVVVLASGHDLLWYLHDDATLRFPVGYRNANAALFLIGLWPLLALAAGNWPWQLRALALAAATMLVDLTVLAQSRGSLAGLAVALLVYLLLSRRRLRAAAVFALAVLPALPAVPTLLDVYQHGTPDAATIPLLRHAALAIGLTALLSLLLSCLALGAVDPRLRLPAHLAARASRLVAAVAVLAVAVVGVVEVSAHGGPVGFVDQRLQEFRNEPSPDPSGTRFGVNLGSNRADFWRVSLARGLGSPLLGDGAGSFEIAYLKERHSVEAPEDPHSVEALMLAELGLPGLALLALFVVAGVVAGLRSWRLGPAAAGLAAGALAGAAQWLCQASYDWLWNYPGVTAPAIFLLGVAAVPALLDPRAAEAPRLRRGLVAGLAALALLVVPLFLSAQYLRRGLGEMADDPPAAAADLGRAADLDPLDAEPLLAKATVEVRAGARQAALGTLREALAREPESYVAHYLLALVLAPSRPVAARRQLDLARALNPRDPAVRELARRLQAQRP